MADKDANFSETIFLTGFPGFIAGRLVERLAASDVQFYLLVQSLFIDAAKQAIERIAAKADVPLENFALVKGDISLPGLGIAAEDLAVIREETTDVHHLAALYDLEAERGLAYRINVEGTGNMIEFCGALPNLRRFNYVSTCYVAGRRKDRIFENELEHDAGFRNHYEETKYLAELEVRRSMESLPVTIYRPSVVVGDSHTGETIKYDGIYSLIQFILRSPSVFRLVNLGNEQVRLNLVPVDFVAEAIAVLAHDEQAKGETLALADPNPITTRQLFDEIAKTISGKTSVFHPPAWLVEQCLMLPFSPPLTGLPHAGVPYFFLSQSYDTSKATKLLSRHGIICPAFSDYVGNLIDFVRKHPNPQNLHQSAQRLQ